VPAAGASGGSAVQGIGFAIPANLARDISQQIITSGTVTNSHRAAIGAKIGTATGSDGRPAGTGIVAVTGDGPADRAGLRLGDVILAAGDTPTPDPQALVGVLAAARPGDRITLSVLRAAQDKLTVTVTLGELPWS
jgi:S1-C subfamily serine protease